MNRNIKDVIIPMIFIGLLILLGILLILTIFGFVGSHARSGTFQMNAMDYYVLSDKDYQITDNVFATEILDNEQRDVPRENITLEETSDEGNNTIKMFYVIEDIYGHKHDISANVTFGKKYDKTEEALRDAFVVYQSGINLAKEDIEQFNTNLQENQETQNSQYTELATISELMMDKQREAFDAKEQLNNISPYNVEEMKSAEENYVDTLQELIEAFSEALTYLEAGLNDLYFKDINDSLLQTLESDKNQNNIPDLHSLMQENDKEERRNITPTFFYFIK